MEFATMREASAQEHVVLHRGLAVLGGLLAGAGLTFGLCLHYPWSGPNALEIVGPMTMGGGNPHQALMAVLVLVGALAGALAGWWTWLRLAHLQTLMCPLPASAALKRAAVPFAVFFPQITFMVQGRPADFEPFACFVLLILGFLLLAFCERGDKRRIYFAHPTENEYHPSALFTHGGVITLGAAAGWFAQSLPGQPALLVWGLWLPVVSGTCVWMLSLLLALVLGLLAPKKTFSQTYLAVALALLPLALLPLQAVSWFQFVGLQTGAGLRVPVVTYLLPATAGVGAAVILVVALIALRRRPVEVQPAWEELFRALTLIAAVPLLLFSLAFWPAGGPLGGKGLGAGLDWLQEGENLANVQALSAGRLPFKEILFRHGFGSDVLAALVAGNWFGPTAGAYRFLLSWLPPLGLVSLYLLAIFCLPWIWALVLALTMVTGNLGQTAGAQYFLTFVGFIFTLQYLQRGNWMILIFSGIFTALASMVSYSAGSMALAGHLILLLGYGLFGAAENKNRLLGLSVYAGSVLLALMPWWLYLGVSGSLGAYFQNIGWVLAHSRPVFSLGLPNWGAAPVTGRILLFAIPPLAVLAGLFNLAAALPKARERGLPWNVLLLSVLAFLLWWRFLNLGELALLLEALPVAVLLLAFILFRLTLHNPMLRGLIFACLLAAVLLPQKNILTLTELAGGFGSKNLIPAAGLAPSSVAPAGHVMLSPQQARDTEALVNYLEGEVGSAEAFYDFSNAPLLYFLVPRRPVVKSLASVAQAPWDQQLETIGNLAEARVKAVIYNGPQGTDLDGIPGEVRQYAISEYLLRKYAPVAKVGGAVMLSLRSETLRVDPAAAAGMQRPVDLEDLPWGWGRLGKYDPSQGSGVGAFAPAGGVKAVEPVGLTVTALGEKLEIGTWPQEVRLHLAGKPGAAGLANVLVLGLQVSRGLDGQPARLAWGEAASGRSLSFRLHGDGQLHQYAIRVGALPAWVLANDIESLDLILPSGGWTFAQARLLAVKDIPELAQAGSPSVGKETASTPETRSKKP